MNIILFDGIPQFISFTDPVGRHIKKVLKAQAGDCLKAGLLNGPRGSLCITAVEAEGYRVEWSESGPPVGLYPLTLLVGFVRPISVKRILREAASLGVERLVFAVTDSGERSYREANLWKTGEYRQYLINGLQTAGATVLPEVVLAGGVGEALAALEPDGVVTERPVAEAAKLETAGALNRPQGDPTRLVLDNVSEGRPLSNVDLGGREAAVADGPGGRRVVLAVGSERGWSDRERGLFKAAGFSSVTLGSRILRTETACSVGAALVLARMGFV
ncbi:MAG: RsmE family RNA methyltransferase [Spirochaetia bacterium]